MNQEEKMKQIIDMVGGDFEYIASHPQDNWLSWEIGFRARDLLIIYFEIQKTFNISIPQESIINGEFCTYESIKNIITNAQKMVI